MSNESLVLDDIQVCLHLKDSVLVYTGTLSCSLSGLSTGGMNLSFCDGLGASPWELCSSVPRSHHQNKTRPREEKGIPTFTRMTDECVLCLSLLCSDMPVLWPQTLIPALLSEIQQAQLMPAQTAAKMKALMPVGSDRETGKWYVVLGLPSLLVASFTWDLLTDLSQLWYHLSCLPEDGSGSIYLLTTTLGPTVRNCSNALQTASHQLHVPQGHPEAIICWFLSCLPPTHSSTHPKATLQIVPHTWYRFFSQTKHSKIPSNSYGISCFTSNSCLCFCKSSCATRLMTVLS